VIERRWICLTAKSNQKGRGRLPVDQWAQNSITSLSKITHVCIGTSSGALVSSAARWAVSVGLLSCEQSDAHVLTVTSTMLIVDISLTCALSFHW